MLYINVKPGLVLENGPLVTVLFTLEFLSRFFALLEGLEVVFMKYPSSDLFFIFLAQLSSTIDIWVDI